jgi:diaminopimelate epimerase
VTALRPEGTEVHVDIDVWERDDEGLRLTSGTATVAFEA